MRALVTSHELCTCTLEREALLERASAGEGVLALLMPLSCPEDIALPVRQGEAVTVPVSPVKLAERFIRLRRKRDTIFADRLFADPAWDMMLDLFQASQKSNRPISVTSLCIASAVPNTTALRWMDTLVRKGLLVRHEDERDRRRTFVSLTDEASRKMREVLSYWAEMG